MMMVRESCSPSVGSLVRLSISNSHNYNTSIQIKQIMISQLHNKNRTHNQLSSSNRSRRNSMMMEENRLIHDTANKSSSSGTLERISIEDDTGRSRSFNHSSSTFGKRSSMSHLTAEEPVLDEIKIEELLDHIRGYDDGC